MDEHPRQFQEGNLHLFRQSKVPSALGTAQPEEWTVTDADWKTSPRLAEDYTPGYGRTPTQVSFIQTLHGYLRALRRLRRQVPVLYRWRGPKEHAGASAELLRSIYRHDFTVMGRIMGKLSGSRPLTIEVIKEWFSTTFTSAPSAVAVPFSVPLASTPPKSP